MLRVVIVILVVIVLQGCGNGLPPGPTTREWTERVDLTNTHDVVVNRRAVFLETRGMAAGSFTNLEQVIAFVDDMARIPPWKSTNLVPMALFQDQSTQEWVVISVTRTCEEWAERGSPSPPYWEHRLRKNEWTEGKVSRSSIGQRNNLLTVFGNDVKLPNGTLSPVDRAKIHGVAQGRGSKYTQVLVDPGSNCD